MDQNIRCVDVVGGTVEISVNDGDIHWHQIVGEQKFTAQLKKALGRGENIAYALIFLAEMGSKIDPHQTSMSPHDRTQWIRFFGAFE